MAYCTASDVRLIVNTSLTDEQITTVIETSDAYIDKMLGSQSSSDKLIKRLSMLMTAKAVKTRYPQRVTAVGFSEDAGNVLETWDAEIKEIMGLYRRSFKRV